ncbi:Glutamyl-tRNA synthetase @ Glutamyl-tRNA(Gln) synthetase [hydrothermal vent metagenome]|uniref:glutamate--tRNA ligase n=1 Tax=hydrothermal vent metagenome TaxID=652676 RepID=A0A3B1D9R7_9ZZZZ
MKVRFAPSPTGYLHIGGARTALFNWMYARSQNGKFVLRIEDTDQQRSSKEFEKEILESMQWLGFDWDEIYYQSERFDTYKEYAHKLLDEKKAYKDGEAIILKMPQQQVKWYDLIRGEITFDTAVIKDQVLMKSDGSPAYSFCCVMDDALMEISHVIRGEDHISNTPKQIIIYEALGFKVPKFAHLPLIMGEDGGRLSKRTGAVAVSDYHKAGFLPDALVNYLMLLGWSPGNNQEMIKLKAAVKKFSIKKVNKTAAAFSIEKLKWLNGQYIKQMEAKVLAEALIPLLREEGLLREDQDRNQLETIINLFKPRMSTLCDFLKLADFMFKDSLDVDIALKEEHLPENLAKKFVLLSERLAGVEAFEAAVVEKTFKNLMEELGIKPSEMVRPIRVAVTGKDSGPGLFEIMSILGKEKIIQRLGNVFKENPCTDKK